MTLFADPSFFILLAFAIVPAACLGLTQHNLRLYGLILSVVFLCCVLAGNPLEAIALLLFLVVERLAVCWLARAPKDNKRFGFSCVFSLAPLVIYKISSVGPVPLWGFVGISYLTFKAVQIVIEVRDGLISEQDLSFVDWLYFLLFFPQLSSGPIDRSRRFLADAHKTPDRDEYAGLLARGILLLLAGAVYYFVVATFIHRFMEQIPWNGSDPLGSALAQIKQAYLYGFYLFFDFQGYCLMAMGASYCLGIRCPRNFKAPFIAIDMFDFWNRWNITLSTWLRDFVFMRLTRFIMRHHLLHNRIHTAQVSLVIDMLVMGFWHGLSVDYLTYGLYHGVLLAATQGFQKRSTFYKQYKNSAWFKALSWFITSQLVIFGFAIFSGQLSTLIGGVFNG